MVEGCSYVPDRPLIGEIQRPIGLCAGTVSLTNDGVCCPELRERPWWAVWRAGPYWVYWLIPQKLAGAELARNFAIGLEFCT